MKPALVRIIGLAFTGIYLGLLVLTWVASASVADWGIIRGARWLEGPGRLVVLEIAQDGPAARAGIVPNDVILAINGQVLDDDFFSKWGQTRRVGDQVKLEVLRGSSAPIAEQGSVEDKTLTLEPRFSMPIFLVVMVLYTIISLLAVSVSLLVLWSRPEDWAARLLAMGMGAYSIALMLDSWAYQFYQLWVIQLFLYLFVFGSAALLHLFLIFPVSSPFITHFKQFGPQTLRKFNVPIVLYGVPLALSILLAQGENVPVALTLFLSSTLLGWAVVALVRGYGRVHTPFERAQLKWITLGLAFGVLGTLVIVLSVFNLRFEVVTLSIAAGTWIFFPISVGIAVLRYRLYEIDLVINRTLVYVPLTGILAGLFSASITLSQKVSVAATGQQSDAATILTTLFVVAAFTPVKDRLQAVVDRRFKEAPDAAKALNAFAENVQSRVMLAKPRLITRRLLEEAVIALGAKSGAAYLRNDEGLELVATVGNWDGDAKLSVPLCAGEKDFGLVSLGERKRGSAYATRDCELLQHTAGVVAIAIQQDSQTG